jgi:hypothetical protein
MLSPRSEAGCDRSDDLRQSQNQAESSTGRTVTASPTATATTSELLALFRPGLHVAEDLLQKHRLKSFENMLLTCKRQMERARNQGKARRRALDDRHDNGQSVAGKDNGTTSEQVRLKTIEELSLFARHDFVKMSRSAVRTYLDAVDVQVITLDSALREVRSQLVRVNEEAKRAAPSQAGRRRRKRHEESDNDGEDVRSDTSDMEPGIDNDYEVEQLRIQAGALYGRLARAANKVGPGQNT